MSEIELIEELRDKPRVKVGPDGFVVYVDHMGSDKRVCDAARVSYSPKQKHSDDQTLLRYLMRHRHTTPFEQCKITLYVRVPMDTWRQWVRHRMASINEVSTRYQEAIDATAIPAENEWRIQSKKNKQGSEGTLSAEEGAIHTVRFMKAAEACRHAYQMARKSDVAREEARAILPLCTYTEAYWTIDLHNLMHFLQLRMAPDAQLEIRDYAHAIRDLVYPLFPETLDAFEAYRLRSLTLTLFDITAIQTQDWTGSKFGDKRERQEYLDKLQRLMLGPYGR